MANYGRILRFECSGLSAHNVVGIGDAENDQAFLRLCECSSAVDNALDSVKEYADMVTEGAYGYSLAEIADFLDRPEDLVGTDIDNGRRLLEQYFREQYLSDLEEQLETDAH